MAGYNESDTCWHILTVTYGGTVSILKNLDAPTARKAHQSLAPDWSQVDISRPIVPGMIKKVDALGPEGCDLFRQG